MTLTLDRDETVLIVTISRPERRNAVDGETAKALFDAFSDFERDDTLTVAVLTGEGGNFCAGADLKSVAEGKGNPVTEDGELGPMGPTRMRLSKPVIAAVEGYAVAGGLELALWCDLRVTARDAKYGVFCRRFGVPLIDLGTIRLPRLIGQSRAADMILTGREVAAEEAFSMGLANRLVAPGTARDEAVALAKEISAFPQGCMRRDRQSMLEQWGMGETEAWHNEVQLGLQTIRSGETRVGASRFAAGTGRHGQF